MYIVVQLVAPRSGRPTSCASSTQRRSGSRRTSACPALGADITPTLGIAIEFVMTLVLVLVVFGTAVDARGPKLGGLAIGLAVGANILFAGPLTSAP